jgi:acetyl esterase/lipase
MFRSVTIACLISAASFAHAQTLWQPSSGHKQVPIWPGAIPDARPFRGPEILKVEAKDLVAGKPWLFINNVSVPTMTVYEPKGQNTGAAVLVFPGGGYQILAIDLEGTEVCDWLTAKGVTCVLLKYRVPGEQKHPKSGPYPESPEALQDAQRTLGLVRLHAAEMHIDPHKIGVLGFSAGGHLAAATSVYFGKRVYPRVDAADDVSCRPDFAVPIYPGHLNLEAAKWDANGAGRKVTLHVPPDAIKDKELALNPEIHVTRQVPPTFLLQNEDDHVDGVYQALSYYIALQRAGVSVEFHSYAEGGHAFGLRRTKLPASEWPDLVDKWLRTIGMVSDPAQ